MPQSGEMRAEGTLGEPAQERMLYFGLLGPSAVSITYRSGDRSTTTPVERGTGAYLIVLQAHRAAKAETYGGSYGYPSNEQGRIRAAPPIVEITYKVDGHLCEEGYIEPIGPHPCPRESPGQARRRAREVESPPDLDLPIDVSLHAISRSSLAPGRAKPGHATEAPAGNVDGVHYTAHVSFRAPFAARNAQSGYSILLGKPGGGGAVT